MSTLAKKLNASLNLTSKLCVCCGGSQGIGASIAVRMAEAGSSVLVVGRNESRLSEVVEDCKKAARDGASGKTFDYISADLSAVSGMQRAISEIRAKSSGSVDYLFQTQGGPPNGRYNLTPDGIESAFAVQVLSRFALSEALASDGVLKEASVTVCAPGGSQTEFDLDDIELRAYKDSFALSLMLAVGKRDGLLTDTYNKSLQSKYPSIAFYHLFPGVVTTNASANQGFPFPLPQLFSLAGPVISRTIGNSPQSYSDIPVLLAANNSAEKQDLVRKEGRFLNQSLKGVKTSPYSEDAGNQEKVFQKLKSYLR